MSGLADRIGLQPEPLLAEELLVLALREELGGRPVGWASLKSVVIGALVADLAQRERVSVRFSGDLGDETIAVIDNRPTGDDVLDRALRVLAGDCDVASAPEVSRGLRIWGARARRHVQTTQTVTKRDIMRWWEGCWRCREFELKPTLLCQLLTLYEELASIHERLHERLGVDAEAPDLGVGWAPGAAVRERLRSVALDDSAELDARTRYVVALCAPWEPTWLRESLCQDRNERGAVRQRAKPLLERDALARAVALVIERYEAQFDGM